MVCLKTNNKVKSLNVAKNHIASDVKQFRMVVKFLNCNKILEYLNLSNCGLTPFTSALIGKGLRGNRNLQQLILKGNQVKEGVIEIAKSFVENKKALSIKELDLSKCQIESEHITPEFEDMIKSKFCSLRVLSLRDNFIKQVAGEQILEALKTNKTIVKVHMDYNPMK